MEVGQRSLLNAFHQALINMKTFFVFFHLALVQLDQILACALKVHEVQIQEILFYKCEGVLAKDTSNEGFKYNFKKSLV